MGDALADAALEMFWRSPDLGESGWFEDDVGEAVFGAGFQDGLDEAFHGRVNLSRRSPRVIQTGEYQ